MGRIYVIGGANIDICGAAVQPLRFHDSNPGMIEVSFGGVGRNIAEICALLGENTGFITVFSNDSYGRMLKEDCENLGMDCSFSMVTEKYPSSMYLAILNGERDMQIALSDMRILRCMDSQMITQVLKRISKDDIIVIDANLDMECVHCIAENAPCSIAADPVSTAKASRLVSVLDRLTIFKPNRYEAEEITGIEIRDDASAVKALEWFASKGVKETIISLGEKGILLGAEGMKVHLTHRKINVENATGGGDSLLAAYICERNRGGTPLAAARFAAGCAAAAIERGSRGRRTLSRELVLLAADDAQIRENCL